MPRPVPFSLPSEIVDAARKQRESAAMSTITSDIDSTLSQGFSGLQGIAQQAAQPLEHFAQSVASGGISVPTLEDLTPDWVKREQQRATEAVSTITTGTLGVQVPSMDDLTPAAMRRPAQQQGTGVAGTTLTGPPASDGRLAARTGTASSTAAPGAAEPLGEIAEGDPQRYFATAGPYARQVERETGVPAALSLAISANETGYGQKRYQAGANNYHGIQALSGEPGAVPYKDWRPGPGGQQEFYNAAQRSFATPLDGFRGFANFLTQNPRYAPALDRYRQTGDVNQLAADVHKAGYAEDPAYTTKITSIMRGIPVSTGVGEVTDTRGVPLATTPQQRPAAQGAPPPPRGGGLDVGGITQAYAGQPYVFGGAGGRSDMRPGVATDCSGFVASVWKNQYGLDLPAHTDGAYNALKQQGAPEIAAADAQPGDVVFYMGAGTGGAITHHMGIAAGGGKVLDMSVSGGDGVKLRDIGHGGRFVVIRDPRVNQQPTRTAAPPPPIVPTGVAERTGGVKLPQGQVNALSQRPVPTGAEPPAPPPVPFAPPVRDDWRQAQPGISVPTLAQLHPNVTAAFFEANNRAPTPDEAAELAALGYGVG